MVNSRDPSWPVGSLLTTTRTQSAGIFPTGFYRLSFRGHSTQAIALYDVNTLKLQMLVYLPVGDDVEIDSSNDCKAPTLTVSFVSLPGIQDLLSVSDQSQVTGTEATVTVSKLADGYLQYDPMPTDMLHRIRVDNPQVVVEVNDSPAACESASSCGIIFNTNLIAPTISSIILAKNQTDNTTLVTILGNNLFGQTSDIYKGDFYDPTNSSQLNLNAYLSSLSDSQVKGVITDDLSVIPAGVVNFVLTVGSRGSSNILQADLGSDSAVIQSISPTSSFLQGGQVLTITGTRFSNYSSSIGLGNLDCPVLSRTPTVITCLSTVPGSVEVVVKQYGIRITGNRGPMNFEFTAINVPRISHLSSSVLLGLDGKTEIQLFGSNLQATDLVVIGDQKVAFSNFVDSTNAFFIAPAVKQSQIFFVRIYRPGLGVSTTNTPLEYSFKVNGVSGNVYGSWMGGISLTINGAGLTQTTANVFLTVDPSTLPANLAQIVGFRSTQCVITYVSSGSITIETGSLQNKIMIQNNGTHPVHGLGFQWTANYIKVVRGDIINWIWTVQSTQQIGLVQLESLGGRILNASETPFQNSSISTQGVASVYFGQLGIYYFANVNLLDMFTVVEVVEVPSLVARIEIKSMGGNPASYSNIAASYTYSPANSCLSDVTCQDLSSFGSSKYFTFAVQACLTPKIQAMSPLQVAAHERILMTSIGLKNCIPRLLLKIGRVTSSLAYLDPNTPSDLFQKALYSDANTLNYGVPYKGVVHHQDYGDSLMTTLSVYPSLPDQYIFLLPGIQGFSTPTTGSVLGGALLVIQATGLDYVNQQNNAVMVGSNVCQIESMTYGQIVCAIPNPGNTIATYTENVISLTVASTVAKCALTCKYRYDVVTTSIIYAVSPSSVTSCRASLNFTGYFIATQTPLANLTVTIGDSGLCSVTSYTANNLQCQLTTCLSRGNHSISFLDPSYGLAMLNAPVTIISLPTIELVSPNQGSIAGSTAVNISGNALLPIQGVLFGNNNAVVIYQDVQSGTITVITPAGSGSVVVVILGTSGSQIASLNSGFTYSTALTPNIATVASSISAVNASLTGTLVQITGSSLESNSIAPSLALNGNNGKYACENLISASNTQLQCLFASLPADVYQPMVIVPGLGLATSSASLSITLSITTSSSITVGTNGGQVVKISGTGFAGISTTVKICDKQATVFAGDSYSVSYRMPASTNGDNTCDVKVTLPSGASTKISAGVVYQSNQNPTVTGINPSQGGTGGGTIVNITGTKFGTDPETMVLIAGATCKIISISDNLITCVTGSVVNTVNSIVQVTVANVGNAISAISYYYVDKWSSVFTWGATSLPINGDFVSIPQGKTVMLDMDTPVLSVLLIDGGKIFFDPNSSVTLNAKYILIINGGTLEIGTVDQPHLKNSGINLFGNFLDKELPLYGAKVLGLRNGTIDIHGKPHNRVWTRIASTAPAGATQIKLQQPVDWSSGDEVVFTSTGRNGSVEENEQFTLAAVSADGLTLTLSTPLKYAKLGETITFDELGSVLFCAKVGLLTRNVKIQGVLSLDVVGNLQKCSPGFVPDTFFSQSCLMDGNVADMPGFNDYGGQIIASASGFSTGSVTMRITGTELYKMGQAFRLGRYPIHYHMNGFMTGSYVKQCSIHKAFNRAVNIHKTNQILFQETVAFDVMGGAFFLEDSVEILNEIRNNLFILCKASNSLLNDDVTPAAYWITNPNNIIVGNIAAGGTHFGFWYRMLEHPTGPSFNTSYCPRVIPLGQFEDNESHSQGWFGLWVHDSFFPTSDGVCGSRNWAQAVFNNFFTWNNGKGAECVNCGAVRFQNMISANNKESALEWHLIKYTSLYQTNPGPSFSDSHVIGFLPQLSGGVTTCDTSGVVLPWLAGFTISNITFHEFIGPTCRTIRGAIVTCICRDKCGGYLVNAQNLRYYNCDNRGFFRWNADFNLLDVDGSISQDIPGTIPSPGSYIITKSAFIPANDCPDDLTEIWAGSRGALRCKGTATPIRFSWNQASPNSITSADVIMSLLDLDQAPEIVPWKKEGITNSKGWMTTLVQGHKYQFSWENTIDYTLFGYTGVMENFRAITDYIIIRHVNISTKPDRVVTLAGTGQRELLLTPLDPATASNGDVYWNETGNYLEYIVRANKFNGIQGSALVNFQTIRCKYPGCVEPLSFRELSTATVRPANAIYWSNASTWGHGSLMGPIPANGDVLTVPSTVWLVIDVNLEANYDHVVIYGVLEIEHGTPSKPLNIHITTNQVGIIGGRLAAGLTTANPLINTMFVLTLATTIEVDNFDDVSGPIMGSQALGAFGILNLNGKPRVSWTRLSRSARKGMITIVVADPVDWTAGEKIVIAPTGLNNLETEISHIISVSSDGLTITLNGSLLHDHIVYETTYGSYTIRDGAEVGLITRNIRIEGPSNALNTGKGGRVLVSQALYNGSFYSGVGQLSYTEFSQMGRLSFTDATDPRYALVFINSGDLASSLTINGSVTSTAFSTGDSFVIGCSFHDTRGTALGAFGSNKLYADMNVFYSVLDQGIRLEGSGHSLRNNLLVYQAGTSDSVLGSSMADSRGFLDISGCSSPPLLTNNTVAGAFMFSMSSMGLTCADTGNTWMNNVLHSSQIGYFQVGLSPTATDCVVVSGLRVYSMNTFAFYNNIGISLKMSEVMIFDNSGGIYAYISEPSGRTHARSNKYFKITNSLIVGNTGMQMCGQSVNPASQSKPLPGSMSPLGGNVGIILANFMSGQNMPDKALTGWSSDNALDGQTIIQGCTIARFGQFCPNVRDVFISSDGSNEDGVSQAILKQNTAIDIDQKSRYYSYRPKLSSMGSGKCGDMECDGFKKIIVSDLDGTTFGSPTVFLPDSAWQWDKDPRYGIGNARIPRRMKLNLQAGLVDVDTAYPNKGVIRDSTCTLDSDMQCYVCTNTQWKYFNMFVESLDDDALTRRIAPIAIATDNLTSNFVDLINGPSDHGLCNGYVCNLRMSAFRTIVADRQSFKVYSTATMPQNFRVYIPNAEANTRVRVAIDYLSTYRLDVYANGNYVLPLNGYYDSSQRLLFNQPNTTDQFKPNINTSQAGDNYYDSDEQLLYVMLVGPTIIDIKVSSIIQMGFKLPGLTIDQFFSGNVAQNIATFLGIAPNRIRVVNIVSESTSVVKGLRSLAPRNVSSNSVLSVSLEITQQPASNFEPNSVISNLDGSYTQTAVDALGLLYGKLVSGIQTGSLSSTLGVNLTTVTLTQPIPLPSSSQWSTFQANLESNIQTVLNYSEAKTLNVLLQDTQLYARRTINLAIRIFDALNQQIANLGSKTSPWTVTYSIVSSPLQANLIVPQSDTFESNDQGWARNGSAMASLPGAYFLLAQVKTGDGTPFKTLQFPLTIKPAPMELRYTSTSSKNSIFNAFEYLPGQSINFKAFIYDVLSGDKAQNLDVMPVNWNVMATICDAKYGANASLNSVNSWIRNSGSSIGSTHINLDSIRQPGFYQVCLSSQAFSTADLNQNVTSNYGLNLPSGSTLEILVRPENYTSPGSGYTAQIILKFPGDFSSISSSLFAEELVRLFASQFTGATYRDFTVSSGSIVAQGTMEAGSSSSLNSAYTLLTSSVSSGALTVTFNGKSYTANSVETASTGSSNSQAAQLTGGQIAGTVIGSVILGALIIGGIVGLTLTFCPAAGDKKNSTRVHPQSQTSQGPVGNKSKSTIKMEEVPKPGGNTAEISKSAKKTPQVVVEEEKSKNDAMSKLKLENSAKTAPSLIVEAQKPKIDEIPKTSKLEPRISKSSTPVPTLPDDNGASESISTSKVIESMNSEQIKFEEEDDEELPTSSSMKFETDAILDLLDSI